MLIQSHIVTDRPKCQSVFVTLTKDMAAEFIFPCWENETKTDQSYFAFEEDSWKFHCSTSNIGIKRRSTYISLLAERDLLCRKDKQQQLTLSLRVAHICVFLNYFSFHHFQSLSVPFK